MQNSQKASDPPAASRRTVWTFGAIIFVGVLALYLFLPTKNYYWDGMSFSLNIEKPGGIKPFLFHPNHLLYEVVGHWVYRVAAWGGLHVRALPMLQVMNGILGALAGLVLYDVLMRCSGSLYIACCCTIFFSVSAMWWKYSTDADAYIVSVLFMLVAFRSVLPPGRPRPLRVGVAHALSMLFHELAVFLYPVLLLGLIYQTRSSAPGRRRRVLVEYSSTAGLLTLATYWLGFTAQKGPHTLRKFLTWITYSSPGTHLSFSFWSNLTKSIKSQFQLLFGGRFTLMEKYANVTIIALVVLLGILMLALFYLLGRHFREIRPFWQVLASPHGHLQTLWKLSVLWIGLYGLFLYFWLPQNTFYRVFYLPPIVFLLAVALSRLEKSATVRRRFRMALFAGIVTLWNLVFFTFPYSHASSNAVVSMAVQMRQVWPAGTTVYYHFFDPDDWYFAYLNPQTDWKKIDPASVENLGRQLALDRKTGRNAWVDITLTSALESTPAGKDWLRSHTKQGSVFKLMRGHWIRFAELSEAQ